MKKKNSSKKTSKKPNYSVKLIAEYPAFRGFPIASEGIAHHGGNRHPLAYAKERAERERNDAK